MFVLVSNLHRHNIQYASISPGITLRSIFQPSRSFLHFALGPQALDSPRSVTAYRRRIKPSTYSSPLLGISKRRLKTTLSSIMGRKQNSMETLAISLHIFRNRSGKSLAQWTMQGIEASGGIPASISSNLVWSIILFSPRFSRILILRTII